MSRGKDAKPHIGIFGRRNCGKSSIINAITGQDIAIVSDIAGTTTDPVKKSMEIDTIGPVILIDTAGIDDTGELGKKRIEKTWQAISTIDAAIIVIADSHFGNYEEALMAKFNDLAVPFMLVHNKSDIAPIQSELKNKIENFTHTKIIACSAYKHTGIDDLINCLKSIIPENVYQAKSLLGDVLKAGDTVLLITPIDLEAPEGRMILPQVQVIRDVLDNDCVAVVAKEKDIAAYISKMNPKPALVITDSQVFPKADASVPKDIPLTSFSIVLARHKGDFANYIKGTPALNHLKEGDRILILESCTHHVSCDDIGRFKIPCWLANYTGKHLEFDTVAGLSKLPRDIHEYAMVIQCGGCMITHRQIINRLKPAVDAGIPVSNYGMAIAWMHGIYNRAVAPFVNVNRLATDSI
ncbi:MAG TPA: [FeFe] hydrogenase H-cluster maturation GTPase HydF [Bacteroidales bacterium]|nr:[FeFe] hydrogenase H-cluster maturation GTPase HydF [Bacteroidales bacterium]